MGLIKKFGKNFISLFLLIALNFGVGYSQQNQIGEIMGINVTGNQTSDPSVIIMSAGLREGEEVVWEDIQQAVRQLWALGIFSDIRILLDHQTPGGVILNIQVGEYPRLEKVEIQGNKKIKKEDLEKEIGFFKGQILSPNHISDARKKLKKMYAEKGYTLAQVDAESFESEKEKRVVLKVEIREGKKVQVKRIQFFGNNVFVDKKLQKQMKKTKEDRWWRGADFNKKEYDEDKINVIKFYRNHGYRDAEIVRDSLYYDQENKDMFIDLWVQEGACYYMGSVSWEGNELFPGKKLESLLEFKEGDVFNQEKFEQSVQEKIGGAYYDLGYIYAQINPKETLRSGDTLDIQFLIKEGNPVKVRKVQIVGNTRTKERVIRRELKIRPGDVFSKELLMRSHRELMMLNYFANITPDVIPVSEEELDLAFKVEGKSTDTANLSAGYSELDRLIGSVGVGMNNLFGNGQQLSLNWNFGAYYRSFSLGFTEPWFLSTPTLIGVNIYDTKRDAYYIGYSQRSQGMNFRFGRKFSWPDNYFRGDWIYKIDRTELADFSSYYLELNPNNIVQEDWPLLTSSVTQAISRNSLDQPEFPTRGSRVSLSTEIAGGPLGGNVGFTKHIFSAELFVPTLIPRLILLTRAQMGFMETLSKSSRIPYLEYFFMGGSGLSRAIPLRGYDDPLSGGQYYYEGGKTMFQFTAELRFPIITNPMMFGLLFAEAGNTWSDLANTDPFDLRRSIGIGGRIFMPMVGIIGVDYAYGFDHIAYGEKYGSWKTHFVFGKSF